MSGNVSPADVQPAPRATAPIMARLLITHTAGLKIVIEGLPGKATTADSRIRTRDGPGAFVLSGLPPHQGCAPEWKLPSEDESRLGAFPEKLSITGRPVVRPMCRPGWVQAFSVGDNIEAYA